VCVSADGLPAGDGDVDGRSSPRSIPRSSGGRTGSGGRGRGGGGGGGARGGPMMRGRSVRGRVVPVTSRLILAEPLCKALSHWKVSVESQLSQEIASVTSAKCESQFQKKSSVWFHVQSATFGTHVILNF